MALVRDRALLLRRHPFSESSVVARVLTRQHGRVHLLARGLFRPRSRYFALLDHFDTLELEWSESPRRELCELRAGEIAVRRRGVTRSLEAYRAGLALLELCDLGSHPAQADEPLFELASCALDELADARCDALRALVVFELRFLHNHGLAPALRRCATCGRAAPPTVPGGGRVVPRAAFSAGAGGRLCRPCAAAARGAGRRVGTLPIDVLEAAALLSSTPAIGATGAGTPAAAGEGERDLLVRTRDFVERFLDYHLETRPRSHGAFLAAPNRNAPSETT